VLNAGKALQTPDLAGFAMQLPQNEGGIINWMEFLWGYGGDLVDDKMQVVVDKGTAGVDSMQKVVDFLYAEGRRLPVQGQDYPRGGAPV